MLRRLSRSIFDLCLPRECPGCRARHEFSTLFCGDCQAELDQLSNSARCPRCAMPVTLPNAPCAQCEGGGVPPLKKIMCLGVLKDPLQSVVHRAKYQGRWWLGELLADRLLTRSDVKTLLNQSDVIVPVPLHSRRQRERGYNQSEVIARRLGGSRVKVRMAADRVKPTEMQSHLHSRAQRMENLKEAFVLTDPRSIAGRDVVLVDDVLTTGATLVSLARTLKDAKPASLSAIVVAVADPKGRAFEII